MELKEVKNPQVLIDLENVRKWAREGATQTEIAKRLGVSRGTIGCRKDVREAFDLGREDRKIDGTHWEPLLEGEAREIVVEALKKSERGKERERLAEPDIPEEWA